MRICVYTLGCKVNQYESGGIAEKLRARGHEVITEIGRCDLYIVNTCAVTNEAERKSRQTVSKMKKLSPSAKIVVCGCSSQNSAEKFADGEALILGTSNKGKIVELLEERGILGGTVSENFVDGEALRTSGSVKLGEKQGVLECTVSHAISDGEQLNKEKIAEMQGVLDLTISREFEDDMTSKTDRVRSYIKVQDGCNNFCSYCIVPYLRGRSRSRELGSILGEIESTKADVSEYVVTGINISDYGKSFGGSLSGLMSALKSEDYRVRLGSLEVSVIDENLLETLKGMPNFCPHFHLSLQSGSSGVLKRMNRHYTAEEYLEKVALIRRYFDSPAITTDIIVGFPTETEAEFLESLRFAEEVGFSDIHVFGYSKRAGTVAAGLKQLPGDVVDERVKRMMGVKNRLKSEYIRANLGKRHIVLLEECVDGKWAGYTANYLRAYIDIEDGKENTFAEVYAKEEYADGFLAVTH